MRQYIFNLLIVVLGTSSTLIITPSQAETPVKSNTQNTDNITSLSSNSPSAIQLSDFANSNNSKPPILSEASNNRHSALQDVIHRYSRIFPNNAQLLSINTENYWGFVIAI
ncbi:hypothetical protein KBT16_26740 [Nostoc sp. CCCryo 231-06]|nr:hypothetical protein [Nostoc sp. CCCryo 231-06]